MSDRRLFLPAAVAALTAWAPGLPAQRLAPAIPFDHGIRVVGLEVEAENVVADVLYEAGGNPDARGVVLSAIFAEEAADPRDDGNCGAYPCPTILEADLVDATSITERIELLGGGADAYRFFKDSDGYFGLDTSGVVVGDPARAEDSAANALAPGNYRLEMLLISFQDGVPRNDLNPDNNYQGIFRVTVGPVIRLTRFQATYDDAGGVEVALGLRNQGTSASGNLDIRLVSGQEVERLLDQPSLAAGETREFRATLEDPGDTVHVRVTRAGSTRALLSSAPILLPQRPDGGGGDPEVPPGGQEAPVQGVDFAVDDVRLRATGEGFYEVVVTGSNRGDADATSRPVLKANIPNVSFQAPSPEAVLASEDGEPLAAGEAAAEVVFVVNLGTDADARPARIQGGVSIEAVGEDVVAENDRRDFDLEVPDDGSDSDELPPPNIVMGYSWWDNPGPSSFGEPAIVSLFYGINNDGVEAGRYEVDFSELVARFESYGGSLQTPEANPTRGDSTPANSTVVTGSIRFQVPQEAYGRDYSGLTLTVRTYRQVDGAEVLASEDTLEVADLTPQVASYPKPNLKVSVDAAGALNPEGYTLRDGSRIRFKVKVENIGTIDVDEARAIEVTGKYLGEDALTDASVVRGLAVDGAVERETEERAIDCDELARIREAGDGASFDATAWLSTDAARPADTPDAEYDDTNPGDNARTIALRAAGADCLEAPPGAPGPCEDGDDSTRCPRCNDRDPATVCPDGEVDCDADGADPRCRRRPVRPESQCDDPETPGIEMCR